MDFDNRSLFVAFFCVSVTLGLALASVWRARPAARGLAVLAGADALILVCALLIGLRGFVPDVLSLFVSNVMLIESVLLAADAFRIQATGGARWRLNAAVLAAASAAMFFFGRIVPSLAAEVVVFSISCAFAALTVALDLLRANRREAKPGARAAAAQFAFFGGLMALRAAITPLAGEIPGLVGPPHPVHILATILAIVISISINLTLMWMVFAEATADLQRANAGFARSNTELDRFAAIVSHDLKAPLNTLASDLGLLREGVAEESQARALAYLASADEGAKRMTALVDEILADARLRKTPDRREPVELGAACQAALDNLRARIAESGGDIEVGPLPAIIGDKVQLVRLFQNLLDNALKYRDPSRLPHIRIRAARDRRFWRISVSDNGIGIAPAERDRIFERYHRLDEDAHVEGVGLGLGICRQIVERHGGRIWVESRPGSGSTFLFSLPA